MGLAQFWGSQGRLPGGGLLQGSWDQALARQRSGTVWTAEGAAGTRARRRPGGRGGRRLTFIISTMVLRAIMAMMVYSNGGDTTNCHMRYWKLCLFCGMCRVSGLALMAKSMQALCDRRTV